MDLIDYLLQSAPISCYVLARWPAAEGCRSRPGRAAVEVRVHRLQHLAAGLIVRFLSSFLIPQ